MSYFLIVSQLFCHPCIREEEPNLTKNGRKGLSWDMEVLACIRPGFFSVEGAISQVFYFHVNGSIRIVQKIDFEIRPDLG